jgi:hypothetical protein
LFHEFQFDVQPRINNVGPDHLSRVEIGKESILIDDELPYHHLFNFEAMPRELV